jgi:DNA-binding response OmpR family regulator
MAYIMIVDDDEDLTNAVQHVLAGAGHEAEVKWSTDDALKAMERRLPDLVILDIMFPEDHAAGLDAAREIARRFGEKKRVPILLLTSVNQVFNMGFGKEDIDEKWMPVADFMEKPVDFAVLQSRVERLLGESGNVHR